jgi:hypothetical protein
MASSKVLDRVPWAAATPDKSDLWRLLERAQSGSPELLVVDLACNPQFVALTSERKVSAISKLLTAPMVQTVLLNAVGLDNTHVPIISQIVLSSSSITALSLERNNLTEDGLLAISRSLAQSRIKELSLANQRAPMSTVATSALLDALEASPSLAKLGLGHLRDEGMRKRYQAITMAKAEAMRLSRRSSTGEAASTRPGNERAASLLHACGNVAAGSSGAGANRAGTKRQLSQVRVTLCGRQGSRAARAS